MHNFWTKKLRDVCWDGFGCGQGHDYKGFSKGASDKGVEALDDSPSLVGSKPTDVNIDPLHVASNQTSSHKKWSHATVVEDVVYKDLSTQLTW